MPLIEKSDMVNRIPLIAAEKADIKPKTDNRMNILSLIKTAKIRMRMASRQIRMPTEACKTRDMKPEEKI